MINHAGAELNGIKGAKKDSIVRCCQFHIVQAISEWRLDTSNITDNVLQEGKQGRRSRDSKGSTRKKDIRISQAVKDLILVKFRELQRCSNERDSETAIRTFFTAIKSKMITDTRREYSGSDTLRSHLRKARATYQDIRQYFLDQWFNSQWKPTFMDWGLPAGRLRDGLSTNNFVESAFRTLDGAFLSHTKNHRVDNLCFALFEFFLHYELHPRPNSRKTKEAKRLHSQRLRGTEWWELGMVFNAGTGDNYIVHNPSHLEGPKDYEVTIRKTSGLRCKCSAFIAAGKECQHTFAVRLYQTLGSYEEFSERQYEQDTQGRYANN